LGATNKIASFLHSLEVDTINVMTDGKLLFLGFTGTDQMKTILIYAVLDLSGEVTSLKTELGSVGTDMKGVTDTISELAFIKPLSTQLWERQVKLLNFCAVWSRTSSLR
jgi:hypothetical protein